MFVSASKLRLITSAIPSNADEENRDVRRVEARMHAGQRLEEQAVAGHREKHPRRRQHAAVHAS